MFSMSSRTTDSLTNVSFKDKRKAVMFLQVFQWLQLTVHLSYYYVTLILQFNLLVFTEKSLDWVENAICGFEKLDFQNTLFDVIVWWTIADFTLILFFFQKITNNIWNNI